MHKLDLLNVSGGFEPFLFNYGSIRDTIAHISCSFTSGTYVLEGECATGGWALSSILSGRSEFDGQILLDGSICTQKQLMMNYGCYAGDRLIKPSLFSKKISIKDQIEFGVSQGKSFGYTTEQIKDLFGLSSERFSRTIEQTGIERWRCSLAIGFANGRVIYCFPWMNSIKLLELKRCLQECLPILDRINAIVLIPTTFCSSLNDIKKDFSIVKLHNIP